MKKIKSLITLILIAAQILSLAACSNTSNEKEKETEPTDTESTLSGEEKMYDDYKKNADKRDQYYDYEANPFHCEDNGKYYVEKNGALSEITKDEYLALDDYIYEGGINASFEADVYMIPCMGQSLAVDTNAGPSTFSETYPLSYDTKLRNVNLQDMNTGFCEGFKLMAEQYGITLPENFKIITCVVGAGGISVNTFLKGTPNYKQVLHCIKSAKKSCDAQGLTMIVPGFMWTQGEEDMRTGGDYSQYGKGEWDPFTYGDRLKSVIEDLNADIKEITGQTYDIECYSYQVASHNTYHRYARIALEQADLAKKFDRMNLAKVMYDLNYDPDDHTHAPAASYRNMGNLYGACCFVTSVLHKEFRNTSVTKVDNYGKEIVLNYDVPYKPLALDTVLVDNIEDGNYGFGVYNIPDEELYSKTEQGISKSETKITSVEVISPTQIKLTLNRELRSDDVLTYAINGLGSENISGVNISKGEEWSGHNFGARGCVRDSNPLTNNNDGAVLRNLYSWMPIYEYKTGE